MSIRLRTVIFSNKVTIANVPIYSCDTCDRSEVLQDVKHELSKLIKQLGRNPEKQQLWFNESNELAFLLYEATKKERANVPVELIVKERVNELLDLLLLAQSLEDKPWTEEIRERLSQIAKGTIATYDLP
jgi:predicted nucleic acid-binding protein